MLQRGMAQLPDLHVTDSSEAMLSGRKPPFRLLVKCVHSDGRRLNIRHAVSEGFVVSTALPDPGLGAAMCSVRWHQGAGLPCGGPGLAEAQV